MTHTFIEYIIQINTNMTCNEQKKEDGILSFFLERIINLIYIRDNIHIDKYKYLFIQVH